MKKILGMVQARVDSKRLPAKVLLPVNGRPAIEHVMGRAARCAVLNKLYLATSTNPENDILAEMADRLGWNLYRGDEDDCMSRLVEIAKKELPDIVVRINGDNFAIDPEVITHSVKELIAKDYDVCSSFIKNTYPFGSGAEASTTECLLRLDRDTKAGDAKYREHVYLYAYEHPKEYRVGLLAAPGHLRRPEINISVDTKEDGELMKRIYARFKGRERDFTLSELIRAWDEEAIPR